MSDTDTHAGAEAESVPSPLFSPDDALSELWVKAYQGEVLGEAVFANIADKLDDPERAAKMRVLSTLERRTKEAMVPSMERAGLPTAPDPEMLSLGEALSEGVSWDDFLRATEEITKQYIPLYRRIGELDPSEQDAADLLVAHEAALRAFARAELAGETSTSLDEIKALAHMH
jgi:hypothetical protein